MTHNKAEDQSLIKKSEAVRLLGFGKTAGYKYLDFLIENNLLSPVYLPGISRARFRKKELIGILSDEKKDSLQFVVHPAI